jgi:hypothetical protein
MKRTKSFVAAGVIAAVATVAVATSASATNSATRAEETTAAAFQAAAQGPDQKVVKAEPRAAWKEIAKKAAGSFLGSAAYEVATSRAKKQFGKAPKGYFMRGGAPVTNDVDLDLDRAFD